MKLSDYERSILAGDYGDEARKILEKFTRRPIVKQVKLEITDIFRRSRHV